MNPFYSRRKIDLSLDGDPTFVPTTLMTASNGITKCWTQSTPDLMLQGWESSIYTYDTDDSVYWYHVMQDPIYSGPDAARIGIQHLYLRH